MKKFRPGLDLSSCVYIARFFFRLRGDTGQVFDIYSDRAMKNLAHRKGKWVAGVKAKNGLSRESTQTAR